MAISAARAKVWLFYLKHSSLRTNIIREICSYLADLQLVQVTPTLLRFFNPSTMEHEVLLRTPIQANENSAWEMLVDGRVFCSGGGGSAQTDSLSGYWSAAYLLSRDGIVEQLPDMLKARCCHGVIQILHIYIFGGYSKL